MKNLFTKLACHCYAPNCNEKQSLANVRLDLCTMWRNKEKRTDNAFIVFVRYIDVQKFNAFWSSKDKISFSIHDKALYLFCTCTFRSMAIGFQGLTFCLCGVENNGIWTFNLISLFLGSSLSKSVLWHK